MKYLYLPLTLLLILTGCGGGGSNTKDPKTPGKPQQDNPTLPVKGNPQQDIKPLVDTWVSEKLRN